MQFRFDWDGVPLATPELPGSGGQIRATVEDFRVTEIPAYEPSGEGEHVYLFVEKRGHTTKFLVEELSRQLGLKTSEVGAAGLKDRHAVTRQWLSVPRRVEKRVSGFSMPDVTVLQVSAHTNKLGIGHLRGNHFRIRVSGVPDGGAARVEAVLAKLAVTGVPNSFGPQRFGRQGRNAVRGLELVQDRRLRGPESISMKRFLIGSLQSLLFNRYVARRQELGVFDGLLLGDVVKKHDTGGLFTVENAELETGRAKRLEVSATGPLYGKKVMPALGPSRALEDEVLAEFNLGWEAFSGRRGSRRITRVRLEDLDFQPGEGEYWLSFTLPKGSFATVVLRELTKEPVDAPEDEGGDDD